MTFLRCRLAQLLQRRKANRESRQLVDRSESWAAREARRIMDESAQRAGSGTGSW